MLADWKQNTFEVQLQSTGERIKCEGWSFTALNPRQDKREGVPNTDIQGVAFVVKSYKALWVGQSIYCDFYLFDGETVMGVKIHRTGNIIFYPSNFNKIDRDDLTLDSLKDFLERHVNHANLGHHYNMHHDRTQTEMKSFLVHLNDVFTNHFDYMNMSSLLEPKYYMLHASHSISDGVLEIDVTSPGQKEGTIWGKAWIRMADRTLLRAEENGVQVYPKEKK